MPAHIYARVGRWHDAVVANQTAIEADDTYLAMCRGNVQGLYPLGYVPHNQHFLWFAASMEGASKIAQEAALQTAARVNLPELMRQPGFARPAELLDDAVVRRRSIRALGRDRGGEPNPAPDLPYVTAIWHYAQAMAAVRQGRLEATPRALRGAREAGCRPGHRDDDGVGSLSAVASPCTSPNARYARSWRWRAVITTQPSLRSREAVEDRGQDSLRRAAGLAFAGAPDARRGTARGGASRPDAEAVYREELKRNPANGWSLRGLAESLRAQKRGREAAETEQLLAAAWANADVQPAASRL